MEQQNIDLFNFNSEYIKKKPQMGLYKIFENVLLS